MITGNNSMNIPATLSPTDINNIFITYYGCSKYLKIMLTTALKNSIIRLAIRSCYYNCISTELVHFVFLCIFNPFNIIMGRRKGSRFQNY